MIPTTTADVGSNFIPFDKLRYGEVKKLASVTKWHLDQARARSHSQPSAGGLESSLGWRHAQGLCQSGESSLPEETDRQMGLCPSAVDRAAAETLWGVQVTSTRPWRFLGLRSPGMGRSGTQPGVGGDLFPPQEFSFFTRGRNSGLSGLSTWHNGAHSQNPGANRPCGERMDSCWTQGPSVP